MEILAVIVLLAAVLTLSAGALRNYWLTQSLAAAQEEVVSQLRALQQNVISETNPRINAAWFGTSTGSQQQWGTVQYVPAGSSSATCTRRSGLAFGNGVVVADATFDNSASAITSIVSTCRTAIPTIPAGASFVFFYARGTATGGTLTLSQPSIDKQRAITVTALTGRVDGS